MTINRHLIVGHFGPDDLPVVLSNADEQVTRLEFVTGAKTLGYGIGDALVNLKKWGMFPSEIGLDLLILAAHVHAADTRISRTEQSQDSWTREIRLVVPVSDPERWQAAASTLTLLLNFLTGDRWTVGFRPRPERFTNITPALATLFPPPFDEVSLFSGGLDSLIGAIDLLENGRTPLLISHTGEGASSTAQDTLFSELERHYKGTQLGRLRVWMSFPNGFVHGVSSENTTRGRSFLFFALGVFAGSGLKSKFVLRVPENGLISLNVPLDPLRLGSNSTRTTHPYYMARWNDLLNELSIDGQVKNPYWDKTKGEMVDECANGPLLKTIVSDSQSCSSPTKGRWIGHSTEHCGYCLPCLIRRAALNYAWGQGADPTSYTESDLQSHPLSTSESIGKQVRSFQVAIERLKMRPDLARILIHKPGPLTDEGPRLQQLAEVYQRGLNEVAQLIHNVRTSPS